MSSSGGHESVHSDGRHLRWFGCLAEESPTWRIRMESPRPSGLFGDPVLDERWKTEQRNLMVEYQRIFNLYVKLLILIILIFPFYFSYHNQVF